MGKPLLNNGRDSVLKTSTTFNWLCCRNSNILVSKKYLLTNYFYYSTDLCNVLLLSPKHNFSEFVTKKNLLTDWLPDSKNKMLQILLYVINIVCIHLKVP